MAAMEARWFYRGRIVMDELVPDVELGVGSLQWRARRAYLKTLTVPEVVGLAQSTIKCFFHQSHLDYELYTRNVFYIYWLDQIREGMPARPVIQVPLCHLTVEKWDMFDEVVVWMQETENSLAQGREVAALEAVVRSETFIGPRVLTVVYTNYVIGAQPTLEAYRLTCLGLNQLSFRRRDAPDV